MFSLFAKSYINTLLNLPCHIERHNTRRVSLTVKTNMAIGSFAFFFVSL